MSYEIDLSCASSLTRFYILIDGQAKIFNHGFVFNTSSIKNGFESAKSVDANGNVHVVTIEFWIFPHVFPSRGSFEDSCNFFVYILDTKDLKFVMTIVFNVKNLTLSP